MAQPHACTSAISAEEGSGHGRPRMQDESKKKKRGAGWLANVLIADGEMGHIHEMFSPFFLFLFVLVSSFKFRFKLKQGSK